MTRPSSHPEIRFLGMELDNLLDGLTTPVYFSRRGLYEAIEGTWDDIDPPLVGPPSKPAYWRMLHFGVTSDKEFDTCRLCQMMLALALRRRGDDHLIAPTPHPSIAELSPSEYAAYARLISYFIDAAAAPFSIHRILRVTHPDESYISHSEKVSLLQSTEAIIKLALDFPSCGLGASLSLTRKAISEEAVLIASHSNLNASSSIGTWGDRPVFILVQSHIDPLDDADNATTLRQCLEFPQSLGILTGGPESYKFGNVELSDTSGVAHYLVGTRGTGIISFSLNNSIKKCIAFHPPPVEPTPALILSPEEAEHYQTSYSRKELETYQFAIGDDSMFSFDWNLSDHEHGMFMGFLCRNADEWCDLQRRVADLPLRLFEIQPVSPVSPPRPAEPRRKEIVGRNFPRYRSPVFPERLRTGGLTRPDGRTDSFGWTESQRQSLHSPQPTPEKQDAEVDSWFIMTILEDWVHRERLSVTEYLKPGNSSYRAMALFKKQLKEVDRKLHSQFRRVLDSSAAREVVMALQPTQARQMLDLAHRVLELEEDLLYEEKVREMITQLSPHEDHIPDTLFITGVEGIDRPPFGGELADVFCGKYEGKAVAVKRLDLDSNKELLRRQLQRIYKEAQVWQGLRHNFLLPFIGIDKGTFAPTIGLVSPWMEEGTVLTYLEIHGREEVPRFILEIAEGLAYLHASKVVHGDLRGANIFVSNESPHHMLVADFGLASTLRDGDADLAGGGMTMSSFAGDPSWWAPELFEPQKFGFARFVRTPETDSWAFGWVCYELVTGKLPSEEDSEVDAVIEGELPSPPDGMRDEIWEIIKAVWAQKADERPSMANIATWLKDVQVVV